MNIEFVNSECWGEMLEKIWKMNIGFVASDCFPRQMELSKSNHTNNMTARAPKRTPREMKSKCCLSNSTKSRLKDLRKRRNWAADARWEERGGVECFTCRAVLPLRNAPREKTNKDTSLMLTSATERSDWIKYRICKRAEPLKLHA